MEAKPFMIERVNTARDPITVVNKMGDSPSPNQSMANGRREMLGIGLMIDTKTSSTFLNVFHWEATEPTDKAMQEQMQKATTSIFKVLRVDS